MAKPLVKIAKLLNVGTTTIVDHLTANGFEIENKPNAKVTDEMYNELLKEFQNSIAVKEKANQLHIGNRPVVKTAEPVKVVEPVKSEQPVEAQKKDEVPEEQPVEPVEKTAETTESTEVKQETSTDESAATEEKQGPKLKVVGKIDLSPKPPVKKKEKKEKEVIKEKQEELVVEQKTETVEAPKQEEEKVEAANPESESISESSAEVDNNFRAKTPQLKGLKILGKIDTDRLKKKKKPEPKKVEKAKPAAQKKADTPATANPNDPKKKRKRKRRKVAPNQLGANRGRNRGRGKPEEQKEVSQKEIDEKIKATMARLSSGGKSKRQKIRRDARDRQREKKELIEQDEAVQDNHLQVTEFISVSELASLMNISATQVITSCMSLGIIVSINQRLDAEIIELVADEYNFKVEFITAEDQIDFEDEEEDAPEDLEHRAPIVTVMGHVDHGKTSLLDYIREANVASGEAGGITQHIGAYEVAVGEDKKKITFLDTPGHEAFTAMRARGAKVTDVAVVIVAADDNIMPQTKEAISHAQAASVPIIFAINKIDKPGAQPERIKQELASMNFLVEEWGGSYQSQDISAKTGENIDLLLEKILLESEILELKANPNRTAIGTVIEASLDKGRGYVTKILVQNGTLKIGDPVVAGEFSGKIKAMFNERGKRVKSAGPAVPVLILGMSGAPQAGEKFKVMDSEQEARQLATKRAQIVREQTTRASKRISLDEIGRRLALGTFKELNLIVKGDVDGSIEALTDSLVKLSVETIQVNVIHKAVGQIIESDILLASASDAIIIGFQVRPSLGARKLAEKEGVQIKTYSVIYKAIEEIRDAMEGMLEPTKEEKITSQVEIRETYKISKIGTVAGCFVMEGKVTRNAHIRLIRDGIVIFPTKAGAKGEISSLKRFKEDMKEVRSGLECGITIKNYNDLKVGDIIEAYEIVEVKRSLD